MYNLLDIDQSISFVLQRSCALTNPIMCFDLISAQYDLRRPQSWTYKGCCKVKLVTA
jgi:hypothetical protein